MSESFCSSDHPGSVRGKSHQYSRRRPRTETNKPDSNIINGPPRWVLDEILDLLEIHTGTIVTEHKHHGDGWDSKDSCMNPDRENNINDDNRFRWKLSDISEAKSAQQQVFILKFEDNQPNISGSMPRKSLPDRHRHDRVDTNWSGAMRSGKNRLVLRIWKGGSRWWNLNRNVDHVELARSEIMGYGVAREAFEECYRSEHKNQDGNNANPETFGSVDTTVSVRTETRTGERLAPWMVPKIPRVLHFHAPAIQHHNSEEAPQPRPQPPSYKEVRKTAIESEASSSDSEALCWAVMEYVGADENDILSTTTDGCCDTGADDAVKGNHSYAKIDRSYLEGMIKIRMEFGFEEPHPRWGRVPVDQALHYAGTILHEVLLPLHRYSSRLGDQRRDNSHLKPRRSPLELPFYNIGAKTFSGMVELYRRALKDVVSADPRQKSDVDRSSSSSSSSSSERWDDRIDACIQRLDEEICFLDSVATGQPSAIPPLYPVLVHLDLQPQNLIFFQKPSSLSADGPPTNGTLNVPEGLSSHSEEHGDGVPLFGEGKSSVFSVLDWEDAAWADPRFDLMLLCRKVCANRHQADAIWCEYELSIADGNGSTPGVLGPIEPWLRLETVHSVATMLLQSVDLVNGGRNPWETKKDLWGKLQREFTRLDLQNRPLAGGTQPCKVRMSDARKPMDQRNTPTNGCCR